MADSRTITVPAGDVEAFRVSAGRRFQITDPEGGQVGVLFAFSAQDPEEPLGDSHTRAGLDALARVMRIPVRLLRNHFRRSVRSWVLSAWRRWGLKWRPRWGLCLVW